MSSVERHIPEISPELKAKVIRRINVLSDIDGTVVSGPEPIKAAIGLYNYTGDVNSDFKLPPQGILVEGNPKSNFIKTVSRVGHLIRPAKAGALKGLELFRSTALEHGREVEIMAITGRTSENHARTTKLLRRPKFSKIFTGFHLNPNKNAHSFKEYIGTQSISEGSLTVLFENDLRAALAFARISSGDVLVYLLKNWTNNFFLLARAAKKGFIMPANIIRVKNQKHAAQDFKKRILEGKF
jgi:hypothetical protein